MEGGTHGKLLPAGGLYLIVHATRPAKRGSMLGGWLDEGRLEGGLGEQVVELLDTRLKG